MSWWNTSNLTDFASKALKNAQQKIDKALDIQGEEGEKTAQASVSKPASEPKADFFSSWVGEAQGTGGDDDSSRSAWSLPWGGSAEKEKEVNTELVREKTAEEIKSEVLKAAKERSKAKAKLFPQKKQTEQSAQGIDKVNKPTESDKCKIVDSVKSVIQEVKIDQKVEGVDKGDSVLPDISQDKDSHVDKERLEDQLSVISLSEKEESFETFPSEHLLSSSPTLTKSEVDSSKDNISDDVCGVTEGDDEEAKSESNKLKPHSDKEETIETDSQNKNDNEETLRTVKTDLPVINDDSVERREDTEINDKSFSEPLSIETDSSSNVTEKCGVTRVEDKDVLSVYETHGHLDPSCTHPKISDSVTETDLEPGIPDISSSVEFVTEKDLTPECEDQEENSQEDVGDQSSSDPELLDCDRTVDSTGHEESIDKKEENVDKPSSVSHSNDLLLKVQETESQDNIVEQPETSDQLEIDSENQSKTCDRQSLTEETMKTSLFTVESATDLERNSSSSDFESSISRLDLSMDTCTSEETVVDQSPFQSDNDLKSHTQTEVAEHVSDKHENTEPETQSQDVHNDRTLDEHTSELSIDVENHDNDEDSDQFKSEDKPSELSPANSFVKCMLEDAIDDNKHDDNSDSHSTEKSDGSRSVYSNQESSDEIDTTTSSDIEIISLPTPNGENRQVSPVDPMPLRIALQKTNWRVSPTHRRNDSSDSSNTSKDGGVGELSPGRDHIEYSEYSRTHHEPLEGARQLNELPALSEEDDNPYHPQRLLKEDCVSTVSHDLGAHDDPLSPDNKPELAKKLGEMAEVLQAREEKLLQLSKDNCDLMETNSILRNQLKQSEEARETEQTDINELTTEFTQRLTDAEKRISSAIREKEQYKRQLGEVQAELTKRAGDISLKQLLDEKEEQIQGLLQEGEKLSKSQLQSNTIIKKLRQKEKDNESTLTSQKKKLETQKEELDHLHKVLESKEELEKKQTEAIAQLNAAVKKQEQEMIRLKSEHEDATEKVRGLQGALDNSYKEMAELHRNNAAQDSKAQEAALSAETQVREELKMTIEKLQKQTKWEKESLNMQIEDLRLSMTRQEKDHNRREDLLRQEIADLQKQLQEDEARTQELTQGVSLATRPLLRQIENLQSTYNAQSATWEKLERNMSDRLSEAQNQLAIVTEKERTANDQLLDLGSKVTSLEAQNSRLKQDRSQMSAQLEMLKTKVEVAEDAKQNEAAQIEVMKQQMEKDMSDLKRQKILLETQLDVEKSKVEQEKKKVLMIQDQMRDMEVEMARSRSRGTPVQNSPSPRSVSRQDSMVNSMVSSLHEHSFTAITQDELDRSFVLATPNGNKQSLYESLRQSGAANLLENLQSQLKLREGEITHLQSEIRNLERTRESMAKELVDLSNQNESLEEKAKELPILTEQYQELDQRYNALLQMYGEKVEESNELRLDLQDIKEMYKSQINQLLGQT